MKDNTLRGEIENILDSKVDGLPSQKLAVEKLEALLAEEVRKARIEEVNRISRYVEIRNTADGATISAEYLYRQARKRIKQLEKEGK